MNLNQIIDCELEYEIISSDYQDIKSRIRQLKYPQSKQEQEIVYNSIYSIHNEIIELTIRCRLLDEKVVQQQFSFTKQQIENLSNECQSLKMVVEKIYRYFFQIPKHINKLILMYNYVMENARSQQFQNSINFHETIDKMQKRKNKLLILEEDIELVKNLCPGCLEVQYYLSCVLLRTELIVNYFQKEIEQKNILQNNNKTIRFKSNSIFSEYLILPDNQEVIRFLSKKRQSQITCQPQISIQVVTENELQQSDNMMLQQIKQKPNFTVRLKDIPNPIWQEQKTINDMSQSEKQRVNSQIFTDFKLPDDRKIQPFVQKSLDLSKSSVIRQLPSFDRGSRIIENFPKRK